MTNKQFVLDQNVMIKYPDKITRPVENGIKIFERDFRDVFGILPRATNNVNEANVIIRYAIGSKAEFQNVESFSFRFFEQNGNPVLVLIGADDLGIIYGLLHISTKYFRIDPFWFWLDKKVKAKKTVTIPIENYDSELHAVRYRGWFINDEVCLIGWKEKYPPTEEVWFPVFETLLRCRGNMVIPGTDLPRSGIHWQLAEEMGLWTTHHHAEPLGAEMFLRAFPDKKASYLVNKELYESLWEEAIIRQKNQKVVWVLSFRGQGDQPFWSQDAAFDTPKKRGELISDVLNKQLAMLKEHIPAPVICVPLYGEIGELYKGGHLDLPKEVIKVWADNGYGKMVSRRNGNENHRIPTMPIKDGSKQGMYYHITFHDLQASNHLTMFPSPPKLLKEELMGAIQSGGNDYLLLNVGNIRMHLYPIDIVTELWTHGDIDLNKHLKQFIQQLYSTHQDEILNLYHEYFQCTIQYGPNEDDRAGDEFYHHPARRIISHWIQGKDKETIEELIWATGFMTFSEQVEWFKGKCETALDSWAQLKAKCSQLLSNLKEEDRKRLEDQLLLQIELHYSGCKGFIALCHSYFYSKEGNFPFAFVYASQAIWDYEIGLDAMKRAEHGKWKNFYWADWLTNINWTIESLITLRKYLRMHGDSPDFFAWYKEFLMPESEKHIYLENTHRNPLPDEQLARLLKAKFL